MSAELEALQLVLNEAGIVHFKARELCSRRRKGGPRVAVPPMELWPNIIPTLMIADAAREALGAPIYVISGYRTPEYNSLVNGALRSEHVEFRALDLKCEHPDFRAVVRRGLDSALARGFATGFGQYDTFVHIDVGSTRSHIRRWDYRSR